MRRRKFSKVASRGIIIILLSIIIISGSCYYQCFVCVCGFIIAIRLIIVITAITVYFSLLSRHHHYGCHRIIVFVVCTFLTVFNDEVYRFEVVIRQLSDSAESCTALFRRFFLSNSQHEREKSDNLSLVRIDFFCPQNEGQASKDCQ